MLSTAESLELRSIERRKYKVRRPAVILYQLFARRRADHGAFKLCGRFFCRLIVSDPAHQANSFVLHKLLLVDRRFFFHAG